MPAQTADTLVLARNLRDDWRFRSLDGRHRFIILCAALTYADREGRFWPTVSRWASDLAVSESAVKRALASAVRLYLLARRPFARPDGRQGATEYQFDSILLTGRLTSDPPCPSSERNRGSTVAHPVRPAHAERQGGPPVAHQNGNCGIDEGWGREDATGGPNGDGGAGAVDLDDEIRRTDSLIAAVRDHLHQQQAQGVASDV